MRRKIRVMEIGNSGSSWRVITVRSEPRGKKARPITGVTSTALGKEETAVRLRAISERVMWHVETRC
jgi:hypothetical protein